MATQTVKRTRRVKKGEAPKGYHLCSSCGGKGYKANVGRKPGKK